MTEQHPITPSPELVRQWQREANHNESMFLQVANQAAQWGADQELEACDAYVSKHVVWPTGYLTSMRRAKAPSLKEQALEQLMDCEVHHTIELNIIRRALEELPNV